MRVVAELLYLFPNADLQFMQDNYGVNLISQGTHESGKIYKRTIELDQQFLLPILRMKGINAVVINGKMWYGVASRAAAYLNVYTTFKSIDELRKVVGEANIPTVQIHVPNPKKASIKVHPVYISEIQSIQGVTKIEVTDKGGKNILETLQPITLSDEQRAIKKALDTSSQDTDQIMDQLKQISRKGPVEISRNLPTNQAVKFPEQNYREVFYPQLPAEKIQQAITKKPPVKSSGIDISKTLLVSLATALLVKKFF